MYQSQQYQWGNSRKFLQTSSEAMTSAGRGVVPRPLLPVDDIQVLKCKKTRILFSKSIRGDHVSHSSWVWLRHWCQRPEVRSPSGSVFHQNLRFRCLSTAETETTSLSLSETLWLIRQPPCWCDVLAHHKVKEKWHGDAGVWTGGVKAGSRCQSVTSESQQPQRCNISGIGLTTRCCRRLFLQSWQIYKATCFNCNKCLCFYRPSGRRPSVGLTRMLIRTTQAKANESLEQS